MNRSTAHPSNYLSKQDVMPPLVLTIAGVQMEALQGDDGRKSKPVMSFREEGVKPMIVNKTNWMVLEAVYGDESDDWIGKSVEVYHDPEVMMMGNRIGGTRVRIPAGTPGAPAPAAAPATDAPKPERLEWEDAKSMAVEVGMDEAALKDALKAEGCKGYSPTRDGDMVRKIIGEVDEIIPF